MNKAKKDLSVVVQLKGRDAWSANRMIIDIDNIYIPESQGKRWNPNTERYE